MNKNEYIYRGKRRNIKSKHPDFHTNKTIREQTMFHFTSAVTGQGIVFRLRLSQSSDDGE